jgi:phage-related minor tail protein
MARQIIAELMRILVVKRMVSGITTALGFADGGAFSGGSQVQAYADGGVVGGPTFFPMSGGKTGLMGEAGPEAIMPLKRGANGKLGVQMEGSSGGAINIVQNFSFAANGDESVKKLIAQAAPQIAQMTQKQIIDSRRRGGAMKSTFG